jgi:hypothetical protein
MVAVIVAALVCAACGAGGGNAAREPTATPPAVGWAAEVEDAPYVAYERVSLERLPRARLEQAGEVRLTQQVRRLPAYRLRDGGASAIRFTDDGGRGWLAWQPSVVLRARRDFAQQEGRQAALVTTLDVTRVEWPNACLGIARAGGNCVQSLTPGFKITLRLGAVTAVFHSDLRDQVQRAPG